MLASISEILIMQKGLLLMGIVLMTCLFSKAADDKKTVVSTLKSVTIYRSGAEMIHVAISQLSQGNNELVIDNISNKVDVNSIQVNCPAAVTILGVEFSNNYLTANEPSSYLKMLQDSVESTDTEIDKINISIVTASDLLDVLKVNKSIKGEQTGLSVAELMKLMDFYRIKSTELQNEISLLKNKKIRLAAAQARLKNQISEEEKKNITTSGRLILQLMVATAGKYDFGISYISPNAYWTPYYDIRVDDIKNPLKVIYKAKIVQTTGIDWKQIKLSLSTSLPGQWGSAPVLQSWFLSYINPIVVMNKELSAPNSLQNSLFGKQAGVQLDESVVTGYGAVKIRGLKSEYNNSTPLYVVNGAIMSEQEFAKINQASVKSIDILKDAAATSVYGARGANGVILVTLKDGLEDYISVTENELNVTFDIDIPYDVTTNGKEQTATLKEYTAGAFYRYYDVPKLDKDVYLLADVPDWEKLNLLPGEANIIFEGTYVGKSFIDPNSTSDTLNLTLGRDKRVVVKREKLVDYSSIKFLGGNKLQKITYELTVKNNKKDSVSILLKDQFPLSTNKEIEVELTDAGGAEVNNDLGILNWKLTLAPGENKKIRFAYSVKYPKDKLVNL
jgi:TonB-dependent SusC/RagA subfamily outer membrane receptor